MLTFKEYIKVQLQHHSIQSRAGKACPFLALSRALPVYEVGEYFQAASSSLLISQVTDWEMLASEPVWQDFSSSTSSNHKKAG